MNTAKYTLFFIFSLITISTFATLVLGCSSNSDIYTPREITINVQPSQPILVQRYKAPNIRIFCFSTQQTGGLESAACPSSDSSKMILCSRKADESDALSSCEIFDSVTDTIERGSINGDNMIWDVMWDGSSLSAQCFPRRVLFSYIVLVRGHEVTSIALFVVLVIIALLVLLLIFYYFGIFVRQRTRRYDSAGVVTMAGPKGNFAGHQFQVRGGAAGEAQAAFDATVPTMFLPVRSNGMGSPLYGADGQELDERQLAELAAMNAEHQGAGEGGPAGRSGAGRGGPNAFTNNPNEASRQMREIAKKGASPPKPGDGIEGFDGAYYKDMPEYGYAEGRGRFPGRAGMSPGSGGDSIRRRRGGPRGRGEEGRYGPNERRAKALFPTHQDWEKNDGFSSFGGMNPDEYGRGESFNRDGSGVYYDENGNPYYSGDGMGPNGPRPGVRYVPQWMHSFHARDEEGGDHFDPDAPDDGLNRSVAGINNNENSMADPDGAIPVGKSRGLQVSELGVYNKPKNSSSAAGPGGKKLGGGAGGDDDETAYEDGTGRGVGGGKKVRFGDKQNPNGGNPSGRNTPTANSSRPGDRNWGAVDENGRPINNSKNGKNGNNNNRHADPNGDSFKRGKATTYGKSLNLGKNRDFQDDGGDGMSGPDRIDVRRQFNQEDYTTTVLGGGPAPVLQCAHCKALLDGTHPRFCAVTGERHN